MQQSEKIYFLQQLNLIAQLYNKDLKEDLCDLYWEELCNYEWQDVRKALRLCAQKSKFMPKIADIIEQLQFIQAPGKPKSAFQSCVITADGYRCPLTATCGNLCSYHGHFSEYSDPTIHGYIMHLALDYPEQMLRPFRDHDTHLFFKMCDQIKKDWEHEKQKAIVEKQAQVVQRFEPNQPKDKRIQQVKDILVKQNSPWAIGINHGN